MTVVLVLVSAMFHALWNALLRVEPDKDRGLIGALLLASVFASIVAGVRWGLGQVPFESAEAVGYTVIAGLFEAAYFMMLVKALERGSLGAVYTISRGGAVLVVWPVSILGFGELVTRSSTWGSGLVLAGLALCGLGVDRSGRGRDGGGRSGVWWAIACAGAIAGYHLVYKTALEAGGSPSATFAVSLSLSATISVVRIGSAGRRALRTVVRERFWRVARIGILCGGSFMLLMEALAIGGSGYVLTLRNTSVLFAVGLAFVIGERPARAEVIGAALVAGGAALMAW